MTGKILLADRAGALHPARLTKVRLGSGAWTPVAADGSFSLIAGAAPMKVRVSLDNVHWTFESDSGKAYEWEAGPFAGGTDAGNLSPAPGSETAKLGVLHLT